MLAQHKRRQYGCSRLFQCAMQTSVRDRLRCIFCHVFTVMQQEGQVLAQQRQYGCSRLHQWPNAGPTLMSTSLGRRVYAVIHPKRHYCSPCVAAAVFSCESPVEIFMPAH